MNRTFTAILLALSLSWSPRLVAQEEGFGTDLGFFKATYYWIAFEKFFPGAPSVPILDVKGRTIAMVSEDFARSVTMEGTGVLRDGRVINLHEKCKAAEFGWCFLEVNRTKAPFGYGSSKPLKPFRTIAVNQGIKPGTVLFFPDFIGVSLPTDEGGLDFHDGCFVAEDVGWSLGPRHVDIFALAENYYKVLTSSIGGKDRVRIYTDSPFCPATAAELYDPEGWVDTVR